MPYPRMYRIRQTFEAPRVDDVSAEVERQLATLRLERTVRPGESVAITAGSRGIANVAEIIRAAVQHFRRLDARPFIVPAMGSHGGGTAEGQREILESYGITQEFTGAEIRSSMETVIVDRTPQGIPVHFDRHAYEADHVLVCGRVKPHTGFVGPIESGLHKMMLIGLGKHAGAKIYHRAIMDYSFLEIIRAVADVVLERCKIVAGLAIVENAYDETGLIETVAPADFFEREQELLNVARRWMPRLPFSTVDLLIVDAIGKNISGSGMDTNVIGRKFHDHPGHLAAAVAAGGPPAARERDGGDGDGSDRRPAARGHGAEDILCKRILVRGLTPETHGNACGIGIAEFTTDRCLGQVDFRATRINAITGGHPTAAATPVALPTDREAIDEALSTVGLVDPQRARVVQIPDTLHLREVLVSEAWLPELERRPDLEVLDGPFELEFDEAGFLRPVLASVPAHSGSRPREPESVVLSAEC